jgi:hypothetical protein
VNGRRRMSNNKLNENRKAHVAVSKALQQSLLSRQPCEKCGASGKQDNGVERVFAHHDDYNRPLHVRWFCTACHAEWHRHNHAIPMNEAMKLLDAGALLRLGIRQLQGESVNACDAAVQIAPCVSCGKEIVLFSAKQRYCSALCRLRSYRKAKHIAASAAKQGHRP